MPVEKREMKQPKFELDAKTHQIPQLEKKPYFPHHHNQSSQTKNSMNESKWGSGYISPLQLVPFPKYKSPTAMMKYGEDNRSREAQTNGRKGYWAEDIIREMSPSMYDTNDTNEWGEKGWYADDIIREVSLSMYPSNSRDGYWAEEILRDSMPTMFGEDN